MPLSVWQVDAISCPSASRCVVAGAATLGKDAFLLLDIGWSQEPVPADLAPDEAAVSASMQGCRATGGCNMTGWATPDGHGSTLYLVTVQVTGDGSETAIFFDGKTGVGQLIGGRGFGPALGPGESRHEIVASPITDGFKITWPSWSPSAPFCCPDGPKETWTYRWDGSKIVVSGRYPPPGFALLSASSS